jgi:hypothetical protein
MGVWGELGSPRARGPRGRRAGRCPNGPRSVSEAAKNLRSHPALSEDVAKRRRKECAEHVQQLAGESPCTA